MKKIYNDYTNNRHKVFICSPSFTEIPNHLNKLDFDFSYCIMEDGIIIDTAIQMIPEIVKKLVEENIAIYQIYKVE